MLKVLRTEKESESSVGIESQVEMLGYYCVRKTPTGDSFLRLKKFANCMKLRPTPAEKLLYNFLEENNIPFKTQAIIAPYIVDFLILGKGLIIELDGKPHNQIDQMSYDTKRDELLMSLGLTVIRYDNDIENYFSQILDIYKDRDNRSSNRLGQRIGYHNQHYQEVGFSKVSSGWFKKFFTIALKRELNNRIIMSYKNRINRCLNV